MKLVKDEKPEYLAVDNIYELAPTIEKVVSLIKKFPPSTSLVQVTGKPPHLVSLQALAAKHKVYHQTPMNPLVASHIVAELAERGVGYKLLVFEDETRILVTRARSLGPGGFSQARYRRRVHNILNEATKHVVTQLRQAGLRYDVVTQKAEGGLSRAEITVYSSINQLPPGVTSYRGKDYQVRVEPVQSPKVEFLPLLDTPRQEAPNQYLIVGVDPGTTKGVSVLSLDGTLLDLTSSKQLSHNECIRRISRYGLPLVVATDVTPVPGFVEKIASAFGAKVYKPTVPLSIREKMDLVSDVEAKVEDDHQRDALAAAIKAYKSYSSKFCQIDSYLQEHGLTRLSDRVKAMVIRGYTLKEAVYTLLEEGEEEEEEEEPEPAKTPEELSDQVQQLRTVVKELRRELRVKQRQIEQLRMYRQELEEKLQASNEKIESLEKLVEQLRRGEEREIREKRLIKAKNDRIQALEKELAKEKREKSELYRKLELLRRMRLLEVTKQAVPVKVIPALTKEKVRKALREYVKQGDVVYLEDPSGGGPATVQLLVQAGVSAVISNQGMSHTAVQTLEKNDIPILAPGDVGLRHVDGFAIADPQKLRETMKKWMDMHKKRVLAEKKAWLEEIITNYREKRKKEKPHRS